jgi:hypothetical protein
MRIQNRKKETIPPLRVFIDDAVIEGHILTLAPRLADEMDWDKAEREIQEHQPHEPTDANNAAAMAERIGDENQFQGFPRAARKEGYTQ